MSIPQLKYCFILTAVFFVCFSSVSGFAQNPVSPIANPSSVRWETDLNVASARAEREQCPLFFHFVGNESPSAQQMANEVFVQPNIVSHLNANFVMVKINASENPVFAQKFSVTAIPTDLIMKPNGQVIHRRVGVITAERFADYLAFLQKMIQSEKNQTSPPASPATNASPVANPASSPFPATTSTPPPGVAPPQRETIAIPDTVRDPFVQQQPPMAAGTVPPPANNPLRGAETARPSADSAVPAYQAPVHRESFAPPIAAVAPAVPPVPAMMNEPAPAKMTVEVPLALEGFCPVTLGTEERWVAGNPAFCTMYQGHIFRFASMEALVTFARNPAHYIPIAMGEDIVLMVDRNKRVNGNRKFGAWFQDRVFLFSSQETLDAFAARPEYYTDIALKYELARKEQPAPLVY